MIKHANNIKQISKFGIIIGVIIGVASASIGKADTASSTNFVIERGVIDAAGGFSTSSDFRLDTSIGQIGTGISSSTSFILKGGFLHFTEPAAATTTPTPTPSVTPSPGPGGGPAGTGFILPPRELGEPIPEGIIEACDFSGDGRCNIIDLSIMLFYYGRGDEAASRFDLNKNGEVDFPDISIMMYYWTG